MASLFGYRFDSSVREERFVPGPLDEPLLVKGDAVGCIVLHGIGGAPGNVRVVSDALIQNGHTVIAALLPGHGRTVKEQNQSTGEQWLLCALDAYDKLKGEGCTRIFALGLSLGGVLSGLVAQQRPLDGLALICAPVVMAPFLDTARRLSPFVHYVRYEKDDPNAGNPYANMYKGFATGKLRDLNRLRKRLIRGMGSITCPTLAVRAAHDNKVDPKTYEIIRERMVNAPLRVCEFASSPHGCTYGPEREAVAALCASFVEECLGSPQGRDSVRLP